MTISLCTCYVCLTEIAFTCDIYSSCNQLLKTRANPILPVNTIELDYSCKILNLLRSLSLMTMTAVSGWRSTAVLEVVRDTEKFS